MHTVYKDPLLGTAINRYVAIHPVFQKSLSHSLGSRHVYHCHVRPEGCEWAFQSCVVEAQRQEQTNFDWKVQDGLTREGAF